VEKKHYVLIMIYNLLRSSDLLPRPRVLSCYRNFAFYGNYTAHACRIIPPPCNSKSPSVTLSPHEVSSALFFFHQTSEVSAKRPNESREKQMTWDNAISVKM